LESVEGKPNLGLLALKEKLDFVLCDVIRGVLVLIDLAGRNVSPMFSMMNSENFLTNTGSLKGSQ
jgi:hypothetical protein